MNLHAIASGAISAVNPMTPATVRHSTGFTTDDASLQVPTYQDFAAQVQVQALSGDELRQMDALNLQGVKRRVYLTGNWDGIVRPASEGGDQLVFDAAAGVPMQLRDTTWLVNIVFESWPDWTSAGITRQVT